MKYQNLKIIILSIFAFFICHSESTASPSITTNQNTSKKVNAVPTLPTTNIQSLVTSSNISDRDKRQYVCNPILVPLLMVKNEEDVVIPTLEPFIKAGLKHIVVLDTGSTDKTVPVIKKYFADNKVENGYVYEDPAIMQGTHGLDYSKGRNRLLELAEEKFPNAGFFLMVDAEWYMQNVDALLDFCKTQASNIDTHFDYAQLYLISVQDTSAGNKNVTYQSPRLIRTKYKLRYEGDIHEAITKGTRKLAPDNFYFKQSPSKKGNENSEKRWLTDRDQFLLRYNENPKDSRTVFYLAKTYHQLAGVTKNLEDYKNAYKYYKERIKLPGIGDQYAEETFIAMYYLAMATEDRAKRDPSASWSEAQSYYLEAFKMRPKRAEPLVKLADHYNKLNSHSLAYLFAKRASEIAYPKGECLPVENDLYDYWRWRILSECAWHEKEYEIGEQAILKAIEARPNELILYKKLSFYWERENK